RHTTLTMCELATQITRSDLIVLPQSHVLAIKGGLMAFCGALKEDLLDCLGEFEEQPDPAMWESLFNALVMLSRVGTVSGLADQSLGWFYDVTDPLSMDPYAIEVIHRVAEQANRTFNHMNTYSPDEK